MKRIIRGIGVVLFIMFCQQAVASNGSYFNISAIGLNLTINTVTPHHLYSSAGIKINTLGYTLANTGIEYISASNGFCLFPVSDTSSAAIAISGPASGVVSFTLCLNGQGQLQCQNYSRTIDANYTIGGSISGLTANGLVLQNNSSDNLSVNANATTFQFATKIANGGGYNVTVVAQPAGLTCTVSNGSGTNVTSNVDNVSISCSAPYAYITNPGSNTVSLCSINGTTGALSSCANTGSGLSSSYGIALNSAMTRAYVANFGLNTISLCSIDSTTGALSGCAGTGNGFSGGTRFVALNSETTFAYVTNGNNVSLCSVNSTTGALSDCASTGSGFQSAGGIALNPAETFAYITNALNNSVSLCEINAISGSLSGCVSTGSGFSYPFRITLNPTGTFAYVTNYRTDDITLCSVDSSTGNLNNCTITGAGEFSGFGNIAINSSDTMAYVPNANSNLVSLCSINSDGSLSGCTNSGGTGLNSPSGITLG